MIVFIAVTKICALKKTNHCHSETIIKCCDDYILQIRNQTTATCVKCLAPGQSCYQTNRQCCPGYRCGFGSPTFPEPRPNDICISNTIIG